MSYGIALLGAMNVSHTYLNINMKLQLIEAFDMHPRSSGSRIYLLENWNNFEKNSQILSIKTLFCVCVGVFVYGFHYIFPLCEMLKLK